MASKVDPGLALSIAGLAGYQLLNYYGSNAPKLDELRASNPLDSETRRKLRDADILVGGTAVILGTTIYALTGENIPLAVMLVMFGTVCFWNHTVLNSSPVGGPAAIVQPRADGSDDDGA